MRRLLVFVGPVFAMVIIFFFISGYFSSTRCKNGVVKISGSTTTFRVSLATTQSEWSHGLSGHAPLSPDEGMLFLFPSPSVRIFWMKDMLFSLDIIWVDKDWNVVGIAEHATPESYPNTFSSQVPVERVLEIPAFDGRRSPVHIGDRLVFSCS